MFVPPYDDPFTIAGQGTIGTEILRQLTTLQLDTLHAIFVPVGGGGLIAGIAAYVKALQPDVKIIGVEPSGLRAEVLDESMIPALVWSVASSDRQESVIPAVA